MYVCMYVCMYVAWGGGGAIGRNWYELLRQYDALMLSTQFRVVTPSNWGAGQDVMLHPAATAEEQRQFRFVEIRPWFRVTPYPDNS